MCWMSVRKDRTDVLSCEAYYVYRTYHALINRSLIIHLDVTIFVYKAK